MVLTRDEALLAAIYAAPDDDAPRQVFADALTERGDVRGEFIALQLARAQGSVIPDQRRRERELALKPENRAAWGHPLSNGDDCHFSRGFPHALRIFETQQIGKLVGQPAVRLLREISANFRGTPEAKAFLLHPCAAGLAEVAALSRELVESLEVPLPWRRVALSFAPSSRHQPHLQLVRELVLNALPAPLSAEAFAGLERLEKLHFWDASPGALEPLTGLVELVTQSSRKNISWNTELASLSRLERLTISGTPSPATVAGLGLKALECSAFPDFDLNGLLDALPHLEELRLFCGMPAETISMITKLVDAPRLKQLRFVALNVFEFTRPGTPEAQLVLRMPLDIVLTEYAPALNFLPRDFVSSIVVRPQNTDPWHPIGPVPEGLELLRAAAKVPVELAWY